MNKVAIPIIGVLIIAIGLMWFFWPDQKPDYSLYEARIAQRDSAFHQLSRKYTKLESKIKSDSVSHKIEVQAYKDRDKKQSASISHLKKNQVVIRIRDSIPQIDTLILAYDSLIDVKNSQIYLNEKYIGQLQMDLATVAANFNQRIALMDSTVHDQKELIGEYKNEIRKERRKKRLTKVIAVSVGIIGFLVGSNF